MPSVLPYAAPVFLRRRLVREVSLVMPQDWPRCVAGAHFWGHRQRRRFQGRALPCIYAGQALFRALLQGREVAGATHDHALPRGACDKYIQVTVWNHSNRTEKRVMNDEFYTIIYSTLALIKGKLHEVTCCISLNDVFRLFVCGCVCGCLCVFGCSCVCVFVLLCVCG